MQALLTVFLLLFPACLTFTFVHPTSSRPLHHSTPTSLKSFDGFSSLDDNDLIPTPPTPSSNPRLVDGFKYPPYNCDPGETVMYDEESIQGILSACRMDIPTLFGYSSENLSVGITGSVDLVELDGPVVVVTLGGRFWHQRPTVLARVKAYLLERCPEIVDVVVKDEFELTDEANV
ncbi:hypothetical protein TrCOL_g7944 [Triparma columacea]|uniref:Uncharacterized protein n=1 Tax=Triparma columacea TaxID=722753 RepID=A0A9W7GA75_9STRA|nr:hypothetical protein TrCOL_g7944 [Triparma columacea]